GFGVIDGVAPKTSAYSSSTFITLGSPTYLSPEQLSGAVQVDEKSDLYAFGCIVYEMLAGEPPFGGSSRLSVVGRKHADVAPRLRSVRVRVPEALDTIVDRCLERLPADRY